MNFSEVWASAEYSSSFFFCISREPELARSTHLKVDDKEEVFGHFLGALLFPQVPTLELANDT